MCINIDQSLSPLHRQPSVKQSKTKQITTESETWRLFCLLTPYILLKFPVVLMRRICLMIRGFLNWWSFPLFSFLISHERLKLMESCMFAIYSKTLNWFWKLSLGVNGVETCGLFGYKMPRKFGARNRNHYNQVELSILRGTSSFRRIH